MDWYHIFYWLTVADNFRKMFDVFSDIFTTLTIASVIIYVIASLIAKVEDDLDPNASSTRVSKAARKWIFYTVPFTILFWSLYLFTPSKKDTLLIIAGGGVMEFLTTDSASKEIPKEMSTFVLNELRNISQDVKLELETGLQKEKIVNEAKSLTGEQLMEKMKLDSNYRKLILGQ
jgi:predicted PurR-regulated permease PerM